MFSATLLALALAAPGPKDPPSAWRADPLPAGFRADLLNEGLPLRWEKGAVHVLAWATVADDYSHTETTQAVVLKRFDRPTEDAGHRWALALLYYNPKDSKRPWQGAWRHFATPPPGRPAARLTTAMQWGYELFADRPTDDQVDRFLQEAGWDPDLGAKAAILTSGEKVTITRTLTAGGVGPVAWRAAFERAAPPRLFPELRKAEPKK